MAAKKSVKKYIGVYYTESMVRKWRERPDRCYWVAFKEARTRRLRWERCGWASEGWTSEAAQRKRYELLEQDRAGEYKPSRERKSEQMTFGEFMEKHYLPWADQNKKRARDDRSLYRIWLTSPFSSKMLNDIGPLDLERLKKDMRQAGKAEATVKHALCLVRQSFNKALAWGLWHGDNPCKSVSFPKPNNARRRFLSHDEAARLLNELAKRSGQLCRIATIALFGGLRVDEIFNLTGSNVDWAHGILYVLDAKNGEARPVFITEPIRSVLNELTFGSPEEPLFKNSQGKQIRWLSKTFMSVVDSLGLNHGISDPRERVTFHTLRHTYASWAVMAGVPLYVVGKALGHKTAVMTQRYSHLAHDSQRSAFEAVVRFASLGPIESRKGA